MVDKDGGERRSQGSCGEGFGMWLLMFGMHPGVLFNGSQIGHGVSLVQKSHDGREESAREWECSQHYTVINL